MPLQVGDTVGDYQVLGLLGRGGMGSVFRVRNLISDRVDAMKVIAPAVAANPDLADRFLREIKVHASLEHPNIAAFRTALRVEDQIVMIMELVEGINLDERLRQGPLSPGEAVHYFDQVLDALAFAHGRGVIHRDIKPANLIVTPGGQMKITDFGIAHSAGDRRLTGTGMAVGSIYYMSPEQVQSAPVDARSDLYSLGVTMYEALTGQRAIQGESDYAILTAHLTQVPAPPAAVNAQVPAALSAVIMQALAKDPADRFQSAGEFRRAMGASSETSSGLAAPAFDPEALATIESRLAALLGPIARQLVLRTARRAASLDALSRSLAEQIPNESDRRAFLKQCGIAKAGTGSQTTLASRAPLDPALLQSAKEKLAPLIGPIAGVLVERTARKARSRQEFVETLAAEIAGEKERRAFLEALR